MEDFRFEQLDIWKESIDMSDVLFDYADKADRKSYSSLLSSLDLQH